MCQRNTIAARARNERDVGRDPGGSKYSNSILGLRVEGLGYSNSYIVGNLDTNGFLHRYFGLEIHIILVLGLLG